MLSAVLSSHEAALQRSHSHTLCCVWQLLDAKKLHEEACKQVGRVPQQASV